MLGLGVGGRVHSYSYLFESLIERHIIIGRLRNVEKLRSGRLFLLYFLAWKRICGQLCRCIEEKVTIFLIFFTLVDE